MDYSVDAVKTIYVLLLTTPSIVTECTHCLDGTIEISIAKFEDPEKISLYDHDHHIYCFMLHPEKNGLLCQFPVEQEMWSHY